MVQKSREILKSLQKAEKVIIPLHLHPDGDSISASLGFKYVLKRWGVAAAVVSADNPPRTFSFLPAFSEIDTLDISNLAIEQFNNKTIVLALDNADITRFTHAPKIKIPKKSIINIDHHISNTNFGEINVVKHRSSTCEILFEIFADWKVELDKNIATYLFTGMYTDTGAFHYNFSPETLEKIAKIIRVGIDTETVARKVSRSWPYEALLHWQKVLDNVKVDEKYGIVWSKISNSQIKEIGIDKETLGSASPYAISTFLSSVKDTDVALLLTEEEPKKIRIELRSRRDVNVAKIAKSLGGGGHTKASGASFKGSLEEAEIQALQAIRRVVKLTPA